MGFFACASVAIRAPWALEMQLRMRIILVHTLNENGSHSETRQLTNGQLRNDHESAISFTLWSREFSKLNFKIFWEIFPDKTKPSGISARGL